MQRIEPQKSSPTAPDRTKNPLPGWRRPWNVTAFARMPSRVDSTPGRSRASRPSVVAVLDGRDGVALVQVRRVGAGTAIDQVLASVSGAEHVVAVAAPQRVAAGIPVDQVTS